MGSCLAQLYSNDFQGCLPSTWPENLPNLTHLTVQSNRLSGELPLNFDSWDSLTSMCGSCSARLWCAVARPCVACAGALPWQSEESDVYGEDVDPRRVTM